MAKKKGIKIYASEFARLGGKARAEKLTAEERRKSALKAIRARWAKYRKEKREGGKSWKTERSKP